MPQVELTVMCMVIDRPTNRVLVQERRKSWPGITFPGGHIEDGESITAATIREVTEETGLTVRDLQPCGVTHWYNDQTRERYFVFQMCTETWSGTLIPETPEGSVFWVDLAALPNLNLASGLRERLPMFEGRAFEGFATWNDRGHNALTFR